MCGGDEKYQRGCDAEWKTVRGGGEIPEHSHCGSCQLVHRFDASETHRTFFASCLYGLAADVTLEDGRDLRVEAKR